MFLFRLFNLCFLILAFLLGFFYWLLILAFPLAFYIRLYKKAMWKEKMKTPKLKNRNKMAIRFDDETLYTYTRGTEPINWIGSICGLISEEAFYKNDIIKVLFWCAYVLLWLLSIKNFVNFSFKPVLSAKHYVYSSFFFLLIFWVRRQWHIESKPTSFFFPTYSFSRR